MGSNTGHGEILIRAFFLLPRAVTAINYCQISRDCRSQTKRNVKILGSPSEHRSRARKLNNEKSSVASRHDSLDRMSDCR